MTVHVPSEARILTSAAFRRARVRAVKTCESPDAMKRLLIDVATKQEPMPTLSDGSGRLHLDIICAVVEAHLEALDEAHDAQESSSTSITGKARLRLAVAALHYVVDPDDVIPDSQPHGDEDDLVVLRWAARMAWGQLPAA